MRDQKTSAKLDEEPGAKSTPDNPFVELIGPIHEDLSDEVHRYSFVVRRQHANRIGVVHGGMLSAFADHALGYSAIVAAGKRPAVTIHMDINYVAAAHVGDKVECAVEIVRETRSLYFLRTDLMVAGTKIATVSGVWKVLTGRTSD